VPGLDHHPLPQPPDLDPAAANAQFVGPAAVVIVDTDRRILHLEGGGFAAHGLRTADWIGRSIDEVLRVTAAPELIPRYAAALGGESQSFEYVTQDERNACRVQMVPVRDRSGAVTSVVAVMDDITDRLRVTAELARSEGRLQEAERMVGVGSWELEVMSGELTFSPGLARILGLTDVKRLHSESHLALVHPDDRERVAGLGEECVRIGSATCEYRVVRPDGTVRILSLQAELLPVQTGVPLAMRGAVLDVTDQREAERERLAAEALFRQGFDAAPVGMSLSDAADGRCLRVNDAMCRLLQSSREELLGQPLHSFVGPDDQAALQQARQQMLSGPMSSFEREYRLIRPTDTVAWGLLHLTPVRRTDGSVEVFYSQLVDVTERKEREARLEHDVVDAVWLGRIRDALDEDRFMLYSQPIVDLVTGQTVQNELLLRMRGEDGSVISPAEFLPVAERFGLISEIDRWVTRQAVEIAAGGIPTEFNLSGRSISDPDIIRELAAALQDTGADPSLLVVEVTETAFIGQTEAGREFAQQVHALGCQLALDDFGTGFSSLSYLKHLPAAYLKIDIDFVRELTASETDARVIRGIVGLAREFNQTTIAEGVEDGDTLMLLKELGVDQAQGYLFGRPAPASGAPGGPDSRARTGPDSVRNPPLAGCDDPISLVRAVFDAFAARDEPAIIGFCRPDVTLRPIATAQFAHRSEPYRGADGIRAYLSDVADVWDELTVTPLTFRVTDESVIGFGRAEGRRDEDRILASLVWVIRLRGGLVASIEVFQAAAESAMTPSQLERLQQSAPVFSGPS
jgi:PAS domain S-box-containing protein